VSRTRCSIYSSNAGLTRVSINLRKNPFEGDGWPVKPGHDE
jgi:hypothetical protein